MSIILFIIILGALIFVHELGHFLLAKKNGIRVDEFAIGFPPRIYGFTKGETRYSLNLIPFGGYVKIFGETPDDESGDPDRKDSMVNKSKWVQAAVLVAGVVFNVIFAWFLFAIVLMSGMPAIVTDENSADIRDVRVIVTNVYADSPADEIGLEPGDEIVSISNGVQSAGKDEITVSLVQDIISSTETNTVLNIKRGGEETEITAEPISGVIGSQKAIGIGVERIGTRSLPIHLAVVEAFSLTGESIKGVFIGLGMLWEIITGEGGSLNQIAGPVGIVALVGNASQFGFANLLSFTAFLSINLAVLNILPFPALDGGRLLMLGIEGVTRRRIKPVIANGINAVGFLILIGLMVVITINDVIKLF